MLRPSTSRGWPALGCAESLRFVTAAMRSMVSSIGAGPTAQLTPITVAPRRSNSGVKRSGGVPSSVLPSSSVVIWATIGRSDTLRTASMAALISFRSRNVSRMKRSTPPFANACAHVCLMHLGHEIGLRHVQRVEALVDEDALGIQHRPHRAVANEHAIFEGLEKRSQHWVIG